MVFISTLVPKGHERDLTLIAGLAGEARVALALVGSHAVSVLAARLAHRCSGGIQRGRDRSVQRPGDYLFQIRMTTHLIRLLLELAVNDLLTVQQ